MLEAKRTLKGGSEQMPLFGQITRGYLRGWRFAFIRFVQVDGELFVDLRCTRPDWPFPHPQPVRFSLRYDQFELRAIPGERAPRLDAVKLMAQAIEHGASQTPCEE